MRVIIAGGRDYTIGSSEVSFLNALREILPITEVVCGMARGADLGGKHWADWHGIPVAEFPANWSAYGRGAGHIRNRQMAEYADALIAFPGGRGTANMLETAEKLGLDIYVF